MKIIFYCFLSRYCGCAESTCTNFEELYLVFDVNQSPTVIKHNEKDLLEVSIWNRVNVKQNFVCLEQKMQIKSTNESMWESKQIQKLHHRSLPLNIDWYSWKWIVTHGLKEDIFFFMARNAGQCSWNLVVFAKLLKNDDF